MTEPTVRTAYRPPPAAGAFATGVFLLTLGFPMLAVAGFVIWRDESASWGLYPGEPGVGTALLVLAALLIVHGAIAIAIAAYRLVARADRAAGVYGPVPDTERPRIPE